MRIFGQHDESTIAQFQRVREGAVDAALVADSVRPLARAYDRFTRSRRG